MENHRLKVPLVGLFCWLSCSLVVLSASAPCQVSEVNYRGWKSYELANGMVSLHVVPEIGGRIIQYQLADHPFLFVNSDLAGQVFPPEENGGGKGGWKNYGGSKLWPAPQGWETDDQWPGPPDPVLDGGAYRGEITRHDPRHVAVAVTSPPDARTGIQFSRTISLFGGGTQVRHDCTMKNISRRPVRWSIWEVIQHDAARRDDPTQFNPDLWAYCLLNAQSVHPKGFFPIFGQATHASWRPDYQQGLLAVKYDYRVGKVGLDSKAGWLAVVNGQTDHCFVARFTWFNRAAYPDDASVEFWLNGAGELVLNGQVLTNAPNTKETPYLMESEILSPLIDLEPDEVYHFAIDWFATRCPKPVVEVTPAGAVHQQLRVTVHRGRAKLGGVFGVFFEGRAKATISDPLGTVLAQEDLGAVMPTSVFRLEKEFVLAENASRISVSVVDSDGQNRGWLGNAPLRRQ